jgi:hypothetical protein
MTDKHRWTRLRCNPPAARLMQRGQRVLHTDAVGAMTYTFGMRRRVEGSRRLDLQPGAEMGIILCSALWLCRQPESRWSFLDHI